MNNTVNALVPYLGDCRTNGTEIRPMLCPYCDGGRNRDKYTFSVNADTGAFNCKRGSCGIAGNVRQLAEHLGVDISMHDDRQDYRPNYFRSQSRPKKVYRKPEVETSDLSVEIVEYFKARGISEDTLIRNDVKEKDGNIVFNYFFNGEIVLVKYKIPRKPRVVNGKQEIKSWREPGGRPVLYGMDDCVEGKPLVIIEGEPDKLVLDECGVENGVSIPSGTNDMGWINECWDFLEKFDELILWADSDKAGKAFIQEVIPRLEDWRIKIVECPHKDANVALYKEGKDSIVGYVNNAKLIAKESITDLADVKRKDYRNTLIVPTGFSSFDERMGGSFGGQLTVWTGYNGSGKSTLLSHLVLNGISKHKTFAYSGELPKEDFKEWMDLQLSGKRYLASHYCEVRKKSIPVPNEKYYDLLDDFYRGKMFLFDSDDYATDKDILKAMDYMAKRENVKVFLIDNLLTTQFVENKTLNENQARYIKQLKGFARKYNAIVHLVAHPRKPDQGQTRVNKYSISGTANITDLADRAIGVHRITDKDTEANETYKDYTTIVTMFKDRKFGMIDVEVLFSFDYHSKRFYTLDEERHKEYSWVRGISYSEKIELEGIQQCIEGFSQIDGEEFIPWEDESR